MHAYLYSLIIRQWVQDKAKLKMSSVYLPVSYLGHNPCFFLKMKLSKSIG